MKPNHQHDWRLTSPHPFGAVQKYKCASCPAIREVRRETVEEKASRLRRLFGGWS